MYIVFLFVSGKYIINIRYFDYALGVRHQNSLATAPILRSQLQFAYFNTFKITTIDKVVKLAFYFAFWVNAKPTKSTGKKKQGAFSTAFELRWDCGWL